MRGRWRGCLAEEAIAGLGPGSEAVGIIGRRLAQCLATPLFQTQRIGGGLKRWDGRCWRGAFLTRHLDDRRRDGHGHEHNGRDPGQHLPSILRLLSSVEHSRVAGLIA